MLVVLCFLPLIALNIGYSFLEGIDHYWKTREQQELANQEIETLAAGSEFSYQFARLAGEFSKSFQSAVESDLKDVRLGSFVREASEKVFRWPFPHYELYTFQIPESGDGSDMLFMHSDLRPGRRQYVRAFEHLVRVNRGESASGEIDRQNEKLLARIIQSQARSDVMATTQRGKASFAFYRYFPYWFLWDYFEVPGKGRFGFFLFSRNDDERKVAAKLLALRDLRDRSSSKGAFIPLYSGYGGAVVQSPLQRSQLFKNWAKKRVSPVETDLKRWLEDGTPPVAELGRYNVYSYLGKSHTHLTLLLMPSIEIPAHPAWLFLTSLFLSGFLLLLLVRGLLLGQWPGIGIRFRFLATYLLVASLPVSLLVISAYGYVTQYRRAIHFQSVTGLQSCLRLFDARKSQVNDQYLAAFAEVFEDAELRHLLDEQGAGSSEARNRILSFFESRSDPLPLLSFAIFDENGQGTRYYAGQSQSEADPAIEAFKYPIVEMLRRKIKVYEPDREFSPLKKSSIQETSLEAYKSMTKNDLVEEVDKRRSFPISRQLGAKVATQIHELVKIDGRERFAIFMVWDDQALDEKTFRQSVNHFGVNSPEYIFLAYRVNPQGLEFLGPPGRDADTEFLARAQQLAEQASFRGSYAGKRFENLSAVAIPSKKYANTVLVGATRHYGLDKAVANRLFFLAAVLLLASCFVLFCAFLSARIILDPITGLRAALDRVAAGNLNIEITSDSLDELGVLCREFSTMTRGLRDREKLATLLSDQAVEAISKSGLTGTLAGETFSGVALVSDIRNFTGLCEEYSPDKITGMLNEHFAQMAGIISEHGGRIYKFIGDAIEAVFPEDGTLSESAAERSFKAASRMLVCLAGINSARARQRLFSYRIGVGLAYGQMHSGAIGSSDTRLDYAILGEPLKAAARLEALSAINPQFPLVVDEAVMSVLPAKEAKFVRLENSSHLVAFCLAKMDDQTLKAMTLELQPAQEGDMSKKPVTTARAQVQAVEAGGSSGLSVFSAFSLGVLLVALVAAGMVFGRQIVFEAKQNVEKVSAAAENLRLIEQMKCDSAIRTGFEANCFSIVSDIEAILQRGSKLSEQALEDAVKARFHTMSFENGRPTKTAVFLFDEKTADSENAVVKTVLAAEGWREEQLQALRVEAGFRRSLDFKPWNHFVPNSAEPILQQIFGSQISMVVLHRELFGKASEIPCNGNPEYFYWDYLTVADETGHDPQKADNAETRPRRVKGVILLSVNIDQIKNSLPLLLNSYQQPDKAIALIDGSGSMQLSRNFPQKLAADLASGSLSQEYPAYIINEDAVNIARKDYRLLVCHLAAAGPESVAGVFIVFLAMAVCLILWFWLKTVRGETGVSRSLAARLWLMLLVSAVIPLITVFFVFDLFLNEDYSVKISQTRADLHRNTDLFELRESFVDPLAWKFVQDRTRSPELKKIAADLTRDGSQANLDRLAALINSWYCEHELVDPMIINFSPRDIAIAGKNGWEYVASGKDQKEANTFGVMLKQIAISIMKSRVQDISGTGIDGAAIEGEMIVDTGLQTVRSLFGDDVFVKLAHGVGLPVLMNVVAGTAGLIIHAVPGIENPEFVIIWLIMFDYESYLARIAANYRGDYLFWPIEAHRNGSVVRRELYKNRHEIVKMASWVASANLPVSGRVSHKGAWYLVEGRPGVSQITSLILGMAPEAPVDSAMARSRIAFELILGGILLCILIIARSVADDILMPIRSLIYGMQQVGHENYSWRISGARTDELGDLCSSFDSMIRGLEEKALMGRMLSKSAQKFSLQESEMDGSKMEFAFLYIGIPTFEAWMSGVSTESLFSDLRQQVTLVSRIVMNAGGDVDKIIGEKILAVFHVGDSRKEAVVAACHAALQIAAAEGRGALPFPVATGLNFGSVIAGFLGVGGKRDFTVIGDAVNVTARIEGLAETMRYQRILASEKIIDMLPSDILAREHGEVELKGKSQPMKLYHLTAANGSSHY
ncbi:MAG: hypothetical protein A2W80_15430 [Candidatus Riflebacteria bacterium GWC2_50_8]|nr:MAG: hypothetical protein A2W80_15430 [Candidatus Riflebacteria bacterium GWC2_50_8]